MSHSYIRFIFFLLIFLLLAPNSTSAGIVNNYFYDENGRLLRKATSYGKYIDYLYDKNGNLKSVMSSYKETFESFGMGSQLITRPTGAITSDVSRVVNGKYSIHGSVVTTQEWEVYMMSDVGRLSLDPNTTYEVSFNYKVISVPGTNGYYDFFVRTPTGGNTKDVGWLMWNDATGTVGSKTVSFTTGPYEDYVLQWGMHYGGAISIDDISIRKVTEGFESGKIQTSQFITRPVGAITSDVNQVVTGKYSIHGSVARTQEWEVYMMSDPGKLRLDPNTTYEVSFKYKTISVPGTNGYYDFFVRTPSGGTTKDVGWLMWNESTGTVGSKIVSFTTGPYEDYVLQWGMHYGGAISIDDIRIGKVTEGFESGEVQTSQFITRPKGAITSDVSRVVNGKYSIHGSVATTQEWDVYMMSDVGRLHLDPNTTYEVSFNYKTISVPGTNGYYDFFVRTPSGGTTKDVGWLMWNEATGTVGSKTVSFTTGPYEDYVLQWGMHYGGAISIDDISIRKVTEGFESGKVQTSQFITRPVGAITSDVSQVVTGKYSIHGSVARTQEWEVYMMSDAGKLRLNSNTTYEVSFKYKTISVPGTNGYYDFFIRTPSGGTAKDVGWLMWNEATGTVGSKTVSFTTGPYEDYILQWGMHYGGAISIDDIQIKEYK